MNFETVHAAFNAALNDYTKFASRMMENATTNYQRRQAQEALDALYAIASQTGQVWYNLSQACKKD